MAHLKTSFLHGEGRAVWDAGFRERDLGYGTRGAGCGMWDAWLRMWPRGCQGLGDRGARQWGSWAVPTRSSTLPHGLLVPKLLT